MRSRQIQARVDLDQIRANAERIRHATGVALIAVIKADAYGLGAERVADALAGIADEFAYFSLAEATELGRPGLVIGPPEGDPSQFRELGLRAAVSTREQVRAFAGGAVAVQVDTGMQRFGCPPEEARELLRLSGCGEAFTHARDLDAVGRLRSTCDGARMHAAASAMLDLPAARLDAVRPGVALYRGALRVSTRLVLVRATQGPVGYTGFEQPHIGLIPAGYSNLLRKSSVVINGRRQRMLEVGMNTTFVSVDPRDRVGDEVVLLGDGLTEAELSRELDCREHEVLCRYGAMGQRAYVSNAVMTAGMGDWT